LESANGELIRVRGVADAPAKPGGHLRQGATLPEVIHTPDRLMQPHVRPVRGQGTPADELGGRARLDATRFREIIDRHGPDAVAFYGSGQLDSEAGYLAVKLFKGSIGTKQHRLQQPLCMASAVRGTKRASAPTARRAATPTRPERLPWSSGGRTCGSLPGAFNRVKAHLKANPGVELIVVDPRGDGYRQVRPRSTSQCPRRDIP